MSRKPWNLSGEGVERYVDEGEYCAQDLIDACAEIRRLRDIWMAIPSSTLEYSKMKARAEVAEACLGIVTEAINAYRECRKV